MRKSLGMIGDFLTGGGGGGSGGGGALPRSRGEDFEGRAQLGLRSDRPLLVVHDVGGSERPLAIVLACGCNSGWR